MEPSLDILQKIDEVNFRWLEAARDLQCANLGSKNDKRCPPVNTSSLIRAPGRYLLGLVRRYAVPWSPQKTEQASRRK